MKTVSRRNFLKATTAASAGVLAGAPAVMKGFAKNKPILSQFHLIFQLSKSRNSSFEMLKSTFKTMSSRFVTEYLASYLFEVE